MVGLEKRRLFENWMSMVRSQMRKLLVDRNFWWNRHLIVDLGLVTKKGIVVDDVASKTYDLEVNVSKSV